MDPLMKAVKAIHTATGGAPAGDMADIIKQRNGQDLFSKLATPVKGLKNEMFDLDGMNCEWIRPDYPHNTRNLIMYCHGGGYTCGSINFARVLGSKLALATSIDVITFEYRLAPEHMYPAALCDARKLWDYLMYLGYGANEIIIAGDSAGGNLALELCLELKQTQRKLPKAMILMSPWTDMAMTGASYKSWKDKDPMLDEAYIRSIREAYVGKDADYADTKYSPLFADLKGMPSALIQVGSNEILRSDSESLTKRLRKSGTFAKLEVYKGGWHVFQQLPIHNTVMAMEQIHRFVEKVI